MGLTYHRDVACKCLIFRDLRADERQPQKPEFHEELLCAEATTAGRIRPTEKKVKF